MKMIDISQGWYPGMPSYDAPWYPEFGTRRAMTPATDPANGGRTFSDLNLFPHNGSHVESGFHFYEDREKIDEVPWRSSSAGSASRISRTRGTWTRSPARISTRRWRPCGSPGTGC